MMDSNDMKWMFVDSEDSIRVSMANIDNSTKGISFVRNSEGQLQGTVTDGDIRRAILNGCSLDEPVSKIMNRNFIFVTENYTQKLITNIFKQKSISQIPVLDDDMRVVDILYYRDLISRENLKSNQVVIMAGGLGTRLMPLTKELPKPMLQIGAKPLLETIINQLKTYGYHRFILCVNYKSDVIKNYFQDGTEFDVEIQYIEEEKRLGTAGAIRLAKEYLTEPFFVVNGDVLTRLNFEQFMDYHLKKENVITVGVKQHEIQIPYGVLDIKDEQLLSLREKPSFSYFINAGIYCLLPDILDSIPANEYYDITQLIDAQIKMSKRVGSFPITEYWLDIGQLEQYNQAKVDYKSIFHGQTE